MSFILLGILNSQVSGAAGGSYELIESNILTSSASSVTFSSIPQDYKHLQIRAVMRSAAGLSFGIQMNGNTGANYAYHGLYGDGSSVSPLAGASANYINNIEIAGGGWEAGDLVFSTAVIDILDYANTSKNTTLRILTGWKHSTYGKIGLHSGFWNNSAAISSVNLVDRWSSSFIAGSRFSLYGIRG